MRSERASDMAMAIRLQRQQREGGKGTRSVRRQLLRLTTTMASSSVSDCPPARPPRPSSVRLSVAMAQGLRQEAARWARPKYPRPSADIKRDGRHRDRSETPKSFFAISHPPRPISCMLSGPRWRGRGAALLSDVVPALLSLGPWPTEQGHAAKARFGSVSQTSSTAEYSLNLAQ